MGHQELIELIKVVEKLRHPTEGCPWDLKQTHQSLLKYLIEESYEFIEATEKNVDAEMAEELGDVLLQVLLHSVIAEQRGSFNLEKVAKILREKLVFRHPHVFQTQDTSLSSEQIVDNWQKLKQQEKDQKGEETYYIGPKDNVFPALMAAEKIGKKTEKINFDWENVSQVVYKVEEEWQEVKEELSVPHPNKDRAKEELGDLLFSVAQLCRHLDLEAEDVLRQANKKFIGRFQKLEKKVHHDGFKFEQLTTSQMDEYWKMVKKEEKKK